MGGDHSHSGICQEAVTVLDRLLASFLLCECMFSVSFLFINAVYMARLRVIALSSMAKG